MKQLKEKLNLNKYNNDFSKKLLNAEEDFINIYKSCNYKFLKGCGSYLFDGYNYEYDIRFYDKQKNLFEIVKGKKNILEIGVYMAHSLLLMLIANESLNITAIDIDNTYAEPSIKYLKKKFPKSSLNFIHGDSLKVINNINKKFDLFHFDGTHRNKQVTMEFTRCLKLTNNSASFLFDDSMHITPLKKNIVSSFKILEAKELNNDLGGNYYITILFPKNILLFFFLKILFFFKNLKWYLTKKFFKILQLKKI